MESISIIIPAYNEEKRLPESLIKIKNYLKNKSFNYEIIIIDDGSTDKTLEIIKNEKELNIKLLKNEKNMGKGYSINRGVKESKNDIILFTDADLSTPIEFLDKFLEWHKKGFDIVIASRGLKESNVVVKQPFYREKMGKFFNFLVRKITGLNLHDTQCGFKSFKNSVAKHIFSKQTIFDFGFDVEILYIANLYNYKIKEVPVKWYNSKNTKVNPFKDSIKMFFELWEIKKKAKNGVYK